MAEVGSVLLTDLDDPDGSHCPTGIIIILLSSYE